MFFLNNGKIVVEISKELRKLRAQEPAHNAARSIMRTAIMGYELADIQKFAVRSAPHTVDRQIEIGMRENAKLGMADLVTQCRMFCLDHYWCFDEIQLMGLEHLQERHVDFKRDGFGESA